MMAKGFEKLASMICAGPQPAAMALCRLGIAMRVARRKMPPMANAPPTDMRTAWGARRRGSWVSSASVEAPPRGGERNTKKRRKERREKRGEKSPPPPPFPPPVLGDHRDRLVAV